MSSKNYTFEFRNVDNVIKFNIGWGELYFDIYEWIERTYDGERKITPHEMFDILKGLDETTLDNDLSILFKKIYERVFYVATSLIEEEIMDEEENKN